jgi:cytoskeletal protein CcmA (bactofilin family)
MNPYLGTAVLFLVAGALFLLPLVPSFWELHRKSDAAALSVIQQHAGEIRYFADSFRGYIKPLEPLLNECGRSGRMVAGTMSDGTDYVVLGGRGGPLHLPVSPEDHDFQVLIAAADDLAVPSNAAFSRDIYARGRLLGGRDNRYRAILGEGDVNLGDRSTVLRWVHAVGDFNAGADSKLYGRISSERSIRLGMGCRFSRLHAPSIEVGQPPRLDPPMQLDHPSGAAQDNGARFLFEGNFEIPPGRFERSLVVRGRLHIRSGARIWGNVKSWKDAVVESGVWVEGSLISAKNLVIGPNCRILGPAIAERQLFISSGTQFGTAENLTTVSAPQIEVAEGVRVFGSLWARQHGQAVMRS